MNKAKYLILCLLVAMGGCSRWENDIAFSNHSEIDIKKVVLHFHDGEFEFGYIDSSHQSSYDGNTKNLSKGLSVTWEDTKSNEFKVVVDKKFFSVKSGGYSFTLTGDGTRVEVSKYKGKKEIDSIVLDVEKI